jgi:hypothetical protein
MEVYCVQAGDCIECGTNLVSIHASEESAVKAAGVLIREKELPWFGQPDQKNWTYKEVPIEQVNNVVGYWKTVKGYDIVVVTRESVLE